MREGYSARQITIQLRKETGRDVREYKIRRDIQYRLDSNPITCIDEIFPNVHHIMIDGYWLPKMKNSDTGLYESKILLLYYDYIYERVIWFSIRDGEKKEYIVEDLRFLRDSMKYTHILSCTCDGGVSIIAGLRAIYPGCIIQRCLVHIERQVRTHISKNPKNKTGKELSKIMNYSILSDAKVFPKVWEDWKIQHRDFINEKTKKLDGGWNYTHSRLRRAIRHIENALPYMFQSDKYSMPNIASTSNKIEGYFGVFAEEGIKEHKGLSPKRLLSFTALWIYLRNKK